MPRRVIVYFLRKTSGQIKNSQHAFFVQKLLEVLEIIFKLWKAVAERFLFY